MGRNPTGPSGRNHVDAGTGMRLPFRFFSSYSLPMKNLSVLLLIASLAIPTVSLLPAAEPGELIFEDNFERSESQETKDEPGNGWGTNSKSRAKGNKQVDLRDGAMYIYLHEQADHAVSVTQPAVFTDGTVGLRFKLEDGKDSLGLNFADPEFNEVHAGHLFAAKVDTKRVQCQDLKTGNMRLDIRQAREAKKPLSEEQQAALKGKDKSFPHPLEIGKWHDLLVQIAGDEITVTINGTEVGRFNSPGIAHPTKRLLRLAVPRNAVVDEVKIWRKK